MSADRTDKVFAICFCIVVVIGIGCFCCGGYDAFFVKPNVDEKANQMCKEQGFDFYESYSRVGIFGKEPLALRCKYVDQYRLVDINKGGDGE